MRISITFLTSYAYCGANDMGQHEVSVLISLSNNKGPGERSLSVCEYATRQDFLLVDLRDFFLQI